MRIAILGSGGVGGYFGGRLAAGTDVTFIARGAHLEALRRRGLRIRPEQALHSRTSARPTTRRPSGRSTSSSSP